MAEGLNENFSTGFIKVYRSILDNILWDKKKKSMFEAWIYILLKANWQDAKVNIGFEIVPIKRGEFLTSQDQLSKAFRWDRSTVRKFLYMIERDHMCVLHTTKKYTKITICNYESYQEVSPRAQQQSNNKATTEQHQHNITKEELKNNKEEEGVFKMGFSISLETELPANVLESAERNQFTLTKNPNTEFIKAQWKVFISERLSIDPPNKKLQFRTLDDYTSYFLNWVRTKKPLKETEHNLRTGPKLPNITRHA